MIGRSGVPRMKASSTSTEIQHVVVREFSGIRLGRCGQSWTAPPDEHHWIGRRGVSLVEVLVAIGICAAVLALLIPAVQYGRAVSHRMRCANNLRQIGIAVIDYVSTAGRHPFSPTVDTWVALAPRLENRTLARDLETVRFGNAAESAAAFQRIQRTPWSIVVCPADPVTPVSAVDSKPLAGFSYPYNSGCLWLVENGYGIGLGFAAGYGSEGSINEILDGLSQTALMTERAQTSAPPFRATDRGLTWFIEQPAPIPHGLDEFVEQCFNHRMPADQMTYLPQGIQCGVGWGTLRGYDHTLPPNAPSCVNGSIPPPSGPDSLDLDRYSALSASSWHGGGAQTLYFGGSVHFTSENIDLAVWRALGSIANSDLSQ